jgi:hypothetical protein
MRTISFNNHQEARSIDAIAKMLLDLPRKGDSDDHHMAFDWESHNKLTAVWRYADGTWGVSFRPAAEIDDNCRKYDNPIHAARAIIDRQHNEHGEVSMRGSHAALSGESYRGRPGGRNERV